MPSVHTVVAISLSLVVLSSQAHALSNHGLSQHAVAARHARAGAPDPNAVNKMIKKRQLIPRPSTSAVAATTTAAEVKTTSAEPAASPAASTSTTPPVDETSTRGGNVVDTIIGNGSASTSSAVSTPSVVSTSAVSTVSTSVAAAATSQAQQQTSSPTLDLNVATGDGAASTTARSASTVIIKTKVGDATSSSTSEALNDENKSSFGKNSMIAIAVVASCVAGALGIWTLIRKWKLSPSRKFEDRMQPIEWGPDGAGSAPVAGSGLGASGLEKGDGSVMGEKHRRAGSGGSHGSFTSRDHDQDLGRNVTGNAAGPNNVNMFADQQPGSLAPPAHDFTAGTAGYQPGPYDYDYNANPKDGYVDLQRGNSGRTAAGGAVIPAGPTDLARGKSLNNGSAGAPVAYDYDYDYPPAHGAPAVYDNNVPVGGAYGGADLARGPSMNRGDAYGGYDNYVPPVPQTQQQHYGAADPYADPYGAGYGGAAYGQGWNAQQGQGQRY